MWIITYKYFKYYYVTVDESSDVMVCEYCVLVLYPILFLHSGGKSEYNLKFYHSCTLEIDRYKN